MTIRQIGLPQFHAQIRELLLKAFLPLILALAFPSLIQSHQMTYISKALIIQTSKMDPPRIAFDEINQARKIAASEWKNLESKSSVSLKSGYKHLSHVPVKDMFRVKKISIPEMTFTENDVKQYIQEQRWMENLSSAEAQRISIAHQQNGTLDEQWSIPTLEQATQKSLAKVIQENPEIAQSVQKPNLPIAQNQVRGEVELRGGLPSGPHWQIEISRYHENVKKEDAQVDSRKSTYSIQVADYEGKLEARLRDIRNGEVIGEGSYRLLADQKNQTAKIVLNKTNNFLATNYQSYNRNPYTLSEPMERAKVRVQADVLLASVNDSGKTDQDGNYIFDQVRMGSHGIMRTEAENFYPALFSVRSGEAKTQALFPAKMIAALKEIVKEQNVASEYPETGSIVWGQIKKSGKPFAGAQVLVENFPAYKVVYLNTLFIPDNKLKGTSENGYFIILDLPAGFHSLLATSGNMYLSHSNTVVDDETLSVAELEINDVKNKTDIKVFDAFTGNPAIANVEMQSIPEAFDITGYADVLLPDVSRLSFMNITPANPTYLKTMMNYDDTNDFIHIPLVSAAWIQSIMARQKINQVPDRGLIVGFVEFENYDIYLGYDDKFPRENFIFFDANGTLTEKATVGGGFLIFNVPLGPQSVVLTEGNSGMLQMQMVDVNTEATSVLKF